MKSELSSKHNKNNNDENLLKPIEYATQKNGEYITYQSTGWEPGDIAHNQAWENHKKRVNKTKQLILENKLSPVAYFMEKNLMTPRRLAGYSGLKKRTVKKHLKGKNFHKITEDAFEKYAKVFDISVDDLKYFNPEELEKNKDQ